MKKLLFPIFLIIAMLAFVGCDDDDDEIIYIQNAPEPPQGVYTVTGNNEIYVFWSGPYSNNIAEYIIKRSYEPYDNYQEIGRCVAEDNPNLDLIYYAPGYVDVTALNGQTYYYAVSTLDKDGYESDLSAEDVFDTPRPEGVLPHVGNSRRA